MIWLLALLWAAEPSAAPTVDPRVEWVELQRSGQLEEALSRLDAALATPGGATTSGARYLRGRLLGSLGRHELASTELATALAAEPAFEPWIRFRLAEAHVAQGHPEVAAGLLATLLGGGPTDELKEHAATLLAEALDKGGDCRLLTRLDAWRLGVRQRRPLEFERAECTRAVDPAAANQLLISLLAADSTDGVALAAAERLEEEATELPAQVALDMAMAFYGQRDFERALDHFSVALAPGALTLTKDRDHEARYAVARSHFWLARYPEAGEHFAALAKRAARPQLAARAHYQQARCFELAGDRSAAEQAYRRAFETEPQGSWSGSSLSARLRLLWLEGEEQAALVIFQQLGSLRRWQATHARAALFLAAGDVVEGRTDRASSWLDTAAESRQAHRPEVAYWQGRLAQASGDLDAAVVFLGRALSADLWDPWSQEARRRLADPLFDAARGQAILGLATTGREKDLLTAWLLAPATPSGAAAQQRLSTRFAGRGPERAFIELAAVPTASWPLWKSPLASIEERLLAVGDWQLGLPAVARHFPFTEERLGLTRAHALAEAGLTRASILAAEILARRAPASLPEAFWSTELARSLYPLAHGRLIRRHAREAGFDPLLLAAVIREESRFDARATSAAAARGLTQFVLPTARRLGRKLGLGEVAAADLYRPETAIRLGSAYLEELSRLFDTSAHQMLAAYNAGEDQAALWRGYCLSDEPTEYLTKVGFRETRGYLRKVLRSRARYREIYPGFGGDSTSAATAGSSASTVSK